MFRTFILVVLSVLFVGNFSFGKEDFNKRMEKFLLEKNNVSKTQMLIDLVTESENANFDKIEKIALKHLQKGYRQNNKRAINSGRFVLAICLLNKGKTDQAKKYLNQSKSFFSKNEDENNLAILYNYLGHCDFKGGKYKEAILSYSKAKNLWNSLDNVIEANHSNSFIGTVLIQMNHLEKAKNIFKESIEILLPLKKNRALSGYYSQLGEIYSAQEKRTEASLNFDKGAEYAFKSGDPGTIARAQNYLAISNFYKGNIEEAIKKFKSSLQYRMQSGDVKLICESFYNIGSVYLEIKKYAEAEEYFKLSIEKAKKYDLYQDQADALIEISNIYKKQNQFEQALKYMSQYAEIKGKMNNQLKLDNKNNAEVVELLRQSENMEEIYSRETRLNKQLKSERNKVRYFMFGGVILLLGSSLLYFKNK